MVGYSGSSDVALRAEDVILVDVKIDLTNGENNPVDRVRAAGEHLASALVPVLCDVEQFDAQVCFAMQWGCTSLRVYNLLRVPHF